jgi:hypothetical protein
MMDVFEKGYYQLGDSRDEKCGYAWMCIDYGFGRWELPTR